MAAVSSVGEGVAADAVDARSLLEGLRRHPAVVEMANEVVIRELNIRELDASDGMNVSLTTRSRLGLTGNLDENIYRVTDAGRSYVDGVLRADMPLYDFGESRFAKRAEAYRRDVAGEGYREVFAKTAHRLLRGAVEYQRLTGLLHEMEATEREGERILRQIRMRYSQGAGTLVEVREAQLLLFDLETSREGLMKDREIAARSLAVEFGVGPPEALLLQRHTEGLVDGFVFEELEGPPSSARSLRRTEFEKESVRLEKKKLHAARLPHLDLALNGVLYDITREAKEYDVYGEVNLSLSLFDSGRNQAQRKRLQFELGMADDALSKLLSERTVAAGELAVRYRRAADERRLALLKADGQEARLRQVELGLHSTGEGLLRKLQLTLELAATRRVLTADPFVRQSLVLDHLLLNERLLLALSIEPSMPDTP